MKRIRSFFQRFFAFEPLEASISDALSLLCSRVHFEPGDIVFDQGDTINAFYWIQDGSVELRHAGNTLKILHGDQLMGEDAVFDSDTTHRYAAVALTSLDLIQVEAHGFMQLVQAHPTLGLQLLKAVSLQHHDVPEHAECNDVPSVGMMGFIPDNFKPGAPISARVSAVMAQSFQFFASQE